MAKRILLVTFGLLFLASARAESVLARWTFSDGSLEDTSGNCYTLEKGETVVASDGCLTFPAGAEADASWAHTTNAVTMSGTLNASVSFWFRQPTNTSDTTLLEFTANPATAQMGAFLFGWKSSRKLVFTYKAYDGPNTRESSAERYDDGAWHQAVGTMSIGHRNAYPTVRLYVDGLPDATATANANEKSFGSGNTFQNAPFCFARLAGSAGTGASFAGDVGETIVYDYAGARSTVSTRGRSSAAGRSSRTKDSGRRFRRWARGTWTESPRSVRRRWS